jgi:putative hydrolase of the HAD superfamily
VRLSDFSLVVFDLDDTLYLERDYARSGFASVAHWLAAQGRCETNLAQAFGARCWALFQAGERGTIFDRALSEFRALLGRAEIDELVRVYREHHPAIRLLPDAELALQSLANIGSPVWIVTDGPLESQRRKITALQLSDRLAGIICTDQWGREFWKPHRRAFESIEQTTGFYGQDCVYVGDNPQKDFLGPRQLGWATIRIRRKLGLHAGSETVLGRDADLQVTSFTELLEAPVRAVAAA